MAKQSPPSKQPDPHPLPPHDFATRSLPIVSSQTNFYRLNSVEFASSIYFDRTGCGRFDSPTQGYGILYVGADIYAAWIETFGRTHGAKGVAEATLRHRNLYEINSNRSLIFADLTGSSLTKIGADARLSSGDYAIARAWAKAIYQHPQQVDGIRYRSRHDDERYCYGLFDRCQQNLGEENLGNLVDARPVLLAEILAHYDYGLL
jgi:hypothetical protein